MREDEIAYCVIARNEPGHSKLKGKHSKPKTDILTEHFTQKQTDGTKLIPRHYLSYNFQLKINMLGYYQIIIIGIITSPK